MALISDIDEIMEFDGAFWKISRDLHLPIRTGSLLRVSEDAYERWGIRVTPQNRDALRAASETFYLKDAVDQMEYPDLDTVLKTTRRKEIEIRMSDLMADLARTFLTVLGQRREKLSVCDIPARDGQVSSAIASELHFSQESLINRTQFHLVDRASARLSMAENNMRLRGASSEIYCQNDASFIAGAQDQRFDVIVSLSHLHHKSFLADYLRQLHSLLADDGVLIIGDWHSAIWDHPLHTKNLLKKIGAEGKRLDALSTHFGELMLPDRDVKLKKEECAAIQEHFGYWQDVAHNVRCSQLLSSMRIHFLEAHDTSEARKKRLDDAGFTTDLDRIRAAFPTTKLENLPRRMMRSDFAVVMVAVKKNCGGKRVMP